MERTFRRKTAPEDLVSPDLARHIAGISSRLGRQVGVLISRDGVVRHVIVGDRNRIEIPDFGRVRAGMGRFRGLRLVHTHLRGESLSRDDLNDLALLRLDAVAVIQAESDGDAGAVEVAHLAPDLIAQQEDSGEEEGDTGETSPFVVEQARDIFRLDFNFIETITALEEEFTRRVRGRAGKRERERAMVIGVHQDDRHFAETLELVRSADVEIASAMRQKRRKVHPRTVVGSGKIEEIVLEAMRQGADVVIFDIDLKPAQARAFEDATGLKSIDRTQLILDVFAQRAKSRDGKLQVELAQLKYSLPRLTEKDAGLSRLVGGIGGRGPGETVLEISRRRINDRVRRLEKEIARLSKQRDLRRRRRRESPLPVLSIIGYTNAGKSTLLNALTNSEIEAKDKLFMTLDPTSRRLRFPREGEVVITDTVGFIADLPPDLIQAFRATLEELADADLLLHVVDAADEELEIKYQAVETILEGLDLAETPFLVVLNKADLLPGGARGQQAQELERRYQGVAVSAAEKIGLSRLIETAERRVGVIRGGVAPGAARGNV